MEKKLQPLSQLLHVRNPLCRCVRSILFFLIVFHSPFSFAYEIDLDDWMINVSAGFGGMGIQKEVEKNGGIVEARKGESPGIIGFDIETFTSERWRFTLGHRRGFRLGPVSSGVGFTGVSWNWYPLAAPPKAVDWSEGNYIVGDDYASFIGVSAGLAQGTITRESDEVDSVTASGVFFGIRAGLDWSWTPGVIIRPEIVASQTMMDSGNLASSMNEFGIMCGLVFHFPDWL